MNQILIISILFLNITVFANPSKVFGVSTSDSNFKEIFENNLKQSQIDIYSQRTKYEMEFSYSNNRPVESIFANDYYLISYSENVNSLATFGFYGGFEFFQSNDFYINPNFGFSYTFNESIINSKNNQGSIYKDVIRFQSIPFFLGAKFEYKAFHNFLNASIFSRLGITYEWVSIAGSLDGINQNHWSSGYSASFGLLLFQPEIVDLNTWFGGVSLSVGQLRPFIDDKQGSKSNFSEAGLKFLL